MAAKKTVAQKRAIRQQEAAERQVSLGSGDRIDLLIADLNKQMGGRAIIQRSSKIVKQQWARRSTGVLSLDVVLNGGLPCGGLVELGGPYSSGKTSLALRCCAEEQRLRGGAVAWVALEPFSKRWARELGFFIPFNEEPTIDAYGQPTKVDSFESASPLELKRMEQAGITDPYAEVSPFVLVQEERGDVALDAAVRLLKSNEFAIIVVDSLGVAKSSSWLDEKEVQDFADYPREPKMISDYTARCLLALNQRYDDSNRPAADGKHMNQTSVIHINQIVNKVGTQARSPWKLYEIKGGEGNKHNHHAIVFVWRTMREDLKTEWSKETDYCFAQQVNFYGLKSKIGPPFLEGHADFYIQEYGDFLPGDFNVARDVVSWAITTRQVTQAGSWFQLGENRYQGRAGLEGFLRNNPDQLQELYAQVLAAVRSL